MQNRLFILCVVLGCSLLLSARTVSKQEIDHIAKLLCDCKFFSDGDSSWTQQNYTIERVTFLHLSEIFAVHKGNCSIYLSSSTRTAPFLASLQMEQQEDEGFLPLGLHDYLTYCEQCIYFAEHETEIEDDDRWNSLLSQSSLVVQNIVSPLLRKNGNDVSWGQSGNQSQYPNIEHSYNKYCPKLPGTETYTVAGCGAVAIAQLMWYWEWPYAAIISDTISKYDWQKMPFQLLNTTSMDEVHNVAKLIRDCGAAANTTYGNPLSNSRSHAERNALTDYFGYENATIKLKSSYTNSRWSDLIVSELESRRPVLYRGQTSLLEGGHRFVIDGYGEDVVTNERWFHINWGWRGATSFISVDSIFSASLECPFYYYQSAITDVYPTPNCGILQAQNRYIKTITNDMLLAAGGGIYMENYNFSSNTEALIITEEEIRISNYFYVAPGATVHLAIRNMNCGNAAYAPEQRYVSQDENPAPAVDTSEYSNVEKFIRDGQLYIRKDGHVYNSLGLMIE